MKFIACFSYFLIRYGASLESSRGAWRCFLSSASNRLSMFVIWRDEISSLLGFVAGFTRSLYPLYEYVYSCVGRNENMKVGLLVDVEKESNVVYLHIYPIYLVRRKGRYV